MSKKDFDEFVKKQREIDVKKAKIDWAPKKDEWLNYLQQLYEQIQVLLREYIESGDIEIRQDEKIITEKYIGEYTALKMFIRFKDREVVLDPVGTNLIGAKGRVDMRGNAGIVKIVLVDKNASAPRIKMTIQIKGAPEDKMDEQEPQDIEWGWKMATPPPRIKYIEINEDSFFDALMEVING